MSEEEKKQDEDQLAAEIVQEKGFLTPEQVEECRLAAARITELGLKRSLLAIMMEKALITREQAREVRAEMARRGVFLRLGGYEILARLGEGGMGTVFRAKQTSLGRMVALKVLPTSLAKDKEYIERFYREARIAGKLSHPNIVQVYDVGESRGRHYIAMELVSGRSVDEILKREGRIEERRALQIVADVARGLAYAHQHNVIHRDIKPSNILLTEDGMAKLSDLGIAKLSTGQDLSLTKSGVAMGTPAYMSPEQAKQAKHADPRSDIYSLGATLYHMVTGSVPFEGETPYDVILKQMTAPLPPPRERNPNLSETTCALIERMMAKKPEDRFQTAEELLAALSRVLRSPIPHEIRPAPPASRLPSEQVLSESPSSPVRLRTGFYVGAAIALGIAVFLAVLGVEFAHKGHLRREALAAVQEGANLYFAGEYQKALDALRRAATAMGGLSKEEQGRLKEYIFRAEQKLAAAQAQFSPPPSLSTSSLPLGMAQPDTPSSSISVAPSPPPTQSPIPSEVPKPSTATGPSEERIAPLPAPRPPTPPQQFKNSIGMTMVRIPEGKMKDSHGIEQHIASFYLSAHEVTISQFVEFVKDVLARDAAALRMESRPELKERLAQLRRRYKEGFFSPEKANLPVTEVSGYHAMLFCRWLALKERRIYRLPTILEWEYACRANTRTRYYWGDRFERGRENVASSNSPRSRMPVGSFPPNPWGLHDMLGNVAEWCVQLRVLAREQSRAAVTRPPEHLFFVCGGDFMTGPERISSSLRKEMPPHALSPTVGFRVLLQEGALPERR